MPHIHDLYDFVVSVFIVRKGRVLLVRHKRYNRWLPIGGHIELDEDPEEALRREIREECGLKVKVLASRPPIAHPGVKPILTPSFVDSHRISDSHRHIAFVYFAVASSFDVNLHKKEHHEFRWFTPADIAAKWFGILPSIRFYCRKALEAAGRRGKSR